MSTIKIQKIGITNLDTNCIVNAANVQLAAGGGVWGAIFDVAGHHKLSKACKAIGGCPIGEAVITPGFDLKAKYIIHCKKKNVILQGAPVVERLLLQKDWLTSMKFIMVLEEPHGIMLVKETATMTGI